MAEKRIAEKSATDEGIAGERITEGPAADRWWAEGLLFENCNCTAVCPGHIHFSQKCTQERCRGYWAIRFDAGRMDAVDLAGISVVVLYDTPPVMVEGGWKQAIVISDRATPAQQRAIEEILTGQRGGPWRILAPFVADAQPTRTAPVRIDGEGGRKTVRVAGILRGAIQAIRGRNRNEPVRFVNIYNQIHNSTQVIARGSTECDDGDFVFRTEDTHGLWSRFRWDGA